MRDLSGPGTIEVSKAAVRQISFACEGLTASAKLVLLRIALEVVPGERNPERAGVVEWRMDEIADFLGVSYRHAQRVMAELVEHGFVRRLETGRWRLVAR